MNLKIMVIDDHQLFLEGLVGILSSFDFVNEVFFENDVNKIRATVVSKKPDLVLLDVNLNGTNGLEVGEILKAINPKLKIIVISMHNHPAIIERAKSSGFEAFLSKDISSQGLKSAVELVMQGKLWDWTMTGNEKTEERFLRNSFNLSRREIQIIGLLVKGFDNEQISKELVLSYHTVKTHRKNIYLKLDISSISQLILFAKKNENIF